MKINQEESIKLYLRVKSPKVIDNPYYTIDETKKIFSLKSRERLKTKENLINLNLDQVFTEDKNINDIYKHTCPNIIKESLNGCSFCFINHGETISDKLNTLIGDFENDDINNNKGIFQNLLLELINYLDKNKKLYSNIFLEHSFVCVNESKVIDLNMFLKKDISNLIFENITKKSKLIQKDKSLINSIKKIQLNISNNSFILNFITKIISLFQKENPEYFSNSYFSIILYINKKISNKIIPISTITFILLNGSEKLNIIENIKINKNINLTSSDIKKQAITASKYSISTQNTYNSIVYLIKQNKAFNIHKLKNKEKEILTKEEIKEIEIMEGRYISNLTALLYKVCFDYKIENIKYYIYANIFPNIGYYKSVKDSILFLFDISKILNKNIKDEINIEKNRNIFETNFMFDLETKVNQQEQTISALSEICQGKNQKIYNLENEYNSQINKLAKLLGFEGDLKILLSGEKSPEAERAKNLRESGKNIYLLNSKIKNLEKLLKKSNEEIEKCKANEDAMKEDAQMVRYLDGINSMKRDKLNEMKIKSLFGQKLNELEKELNNKNIIINKLKQDLDKKNNIIQNFSKFFTKKIPTDDEEKKTEENNEKNEEEQMMSTITRELKLRKDKKEIELDKIMKEYEKKLNDENDFWSNQIESKNNEIKKIKDSYDKLIEREKEKDKIIDKYKIEISRLNDAILNNKEAIKYNEKEIMNLNEILMDIIYNYNSYFINKMKPNINSITLENKISDFNIYITEKEKEINQLNFPILHILLEKNNKLSDNYKIKVDKNIKLKYEFKKEKSCSNISNKTSKNKITENKKENININNKPLYNSIEALLTKKDLEKMKQNKLINYCLELNQRINAAEKYTKRFQEINLENEENKKQITYLNFKLKRLIAELEKMHNINNNNKVVINSQNRTIDKFQNNKSNIMSIITNDNIENIGIPLTSRKSLHFNKSQANLKTYDNIYNKIFLKKRNRGSKYNNIFLGMKTENKGTNNFKNKNIKELQISNDYFGINSDIQTIDTNNFDELMSFKSNKHNNNRKNRFQKEFSASYTNFYSQN